MLPCELANYSEGSLLEAINLSINRLGNQHIDQNLNTLGMQIIVVSGGYGFYWVCPDIGAYTW